jgi:hypothetical protein
MARCRTWSQCLEYPLVEARYELHVDAGNVIDAKIVGYFADEFGERHEFVRWDKCHGQFHKHCLYGKKQGKEAITSPLAEAFIEARSDLQENWARYKKGYIRNHMTLNKG